MKQARRQRQGDREQQRGEPARARAPREARQVRDAHQQRLQEALDPAAALAGPGTERRHRLFARSRCDHRRAVTELGQPESEVCVLGHVVGIPAARILERCAPEMVARAPERQRPAPARKGGQNHMEKRGVLERELVREPSLARIVPEERRLDAGEPRVARVERVERGAQLIPRRTILRVVDDHVVAPGVGEGEVERAGLGARASRRREQRLEGRS